MKKPRFTVGRHRELGKELAALDDWLVKLAVEIETAYPVTSQALHQARRAQWVVALLRSALEDELFKEHPGMGFELLDVYSLKPEDITT